MTSFDEQPESDDPPRRRRPMRVIVATIAVIALVLAGTLSVVLALRDSGGSSRDDTSPRPPESTQAPDPALASFYEQEIDWQSCRDGGGTDCGTIEVPLDYADPSGETIELAMLRDPASEPGQRIGSLLVNPGGPGAPGTDYAALGGLAFGTPVRDRFDIVGFDPRGIGDSSAVDCLTDDELDEYVAVDPVPDNTREVKELRGAAAGMAEGCQENSGELAAHVSTVEAARDMDIIRSVLGETKLNYLGASYGTKLGSVYASLFADKVGGFVLDAALDPDSSGREVNLVQAVGFEVALRSYVENCVDQGDCYLGDTVDQALTRVRTFLDDVDAEPLPAGDRTLTVGNAFLGIILPLYSRDSWSALDQALQAAFDGDGAPLLGLADLYNSRGPDGYEDNSTEANWAINCLDTPSSWTPRQVRQHLPEFEKASPTFGATLAWMMVGCEGQELKASEASPDIEAKGADPILVIGTTRDPATPHRWAVSLAKKLDSGVLISRDGDGHGGYHAGNDCVDEAVERYLIEGTPPDDGLKC